MRRMTTKALVAYSLGQIIWTVWMVLNSVATTLPAEQCTLNVPGISVLHRKMLCLDDLHVLLLSTIRVEHWGVVG